MKKLLAFVLSLMPALAQAVPAVSGVSGTVSDGESITISGSGFGTKATAAPQVWDDFDGGSHGSNIPGNAPVSTTLESGSWTWENVASGGTAQPVYTNTNQRTGSALCQLADFNGAQYNMSLAVEPGSGLVQDEYFFSYYIYYDHYAGSISRNTKPFTVYGNVDGYTPHIYSGWGNLGDPSNRINTVDPPDDYGGPSTPDFYDQWFKIDVYIRQSNPAGTANAITKWWATEPGSGQVLEIDMVNYTSRNSGGPPNSFSLFTFFGAYCDADPADRRYRVYGDDFYLDNTQARVELGNASTFAASTIHEIQPATAWSTGSISVTVNQGAFTNGSDVYAYVFDSDGLVNATGYGPIEVGAGSGPTPIYAPIYGGP